MWWLSGLHITVYVFVYVSWIGVPKKNFSLGKKVIHFLSQVITILWFGQNFFSNALMGICSKKTLYLSVSRVFVTEGVIVQAFYIMQSHAL